MFQGAPLTKLIPPTVGFPDGVQDGDADGVEMQTGSRSADALETPKASFIPAQGIRPGFAAPCSHGRPKACFIVFSPWLLKTRKDESRLQRWRPALGQ